MALSVAQFGTEIVALKKRVLYESTSVIYEGMPVCYNYDTTDNVLGYSDSTGGQPECQTTPGTTAEGYQNEGKFLRVEDPATANLNWLAGFVAPGSWVGKTGDGKTWLEIYVPNGSIIPVRTNLSTTVGVTVMGVGNALSYLTTVTTDGDPAACAVAEETVDRSGTTGLVLAKVWPTGQVFNGFNAYFAPRRHLTTGDASGVRLVLDDLYTGAGAAGPRTWGLYITGDKESGIIATAGADDAALRISVNNYVANEEIFNWRGLNVVASNRDGGTVGELDNVISVSAKQGSTNAKIIGLQVDAQSLSADTADEMVGLDVALNREGGVSTEEAGIRIRTRGTINTAINTAIRIDKGATDHGFINLFNIESDAVDVIAASGDITFTTSDKLIPIVFNGTTYYLVATDNV